MDIQTRDRKLNEERRRLTTLPGWQIAHMLTTLAKLPHSYKGIEFEALLIEASRRVWST